MGNKPITLRYSSSNDDFTGAISLSFPEGVIYPDHTQTAALTLSVGSAPEVGGSAMIYIIANGSAITIPSDWVQIGGDAISTVNGNTNILTVAYIAPDKIHYSNKVVTP